MSALIPNMVHVIMSTIALMRSTNSFSGSARRVHTPLKLLWAILRRTANRARLFGFCPIIFRGNLSIFSMRIINISEELEKELVPVQLATESRYC